MKLFVVPIVIALIGYGIGRYTFDQIMNMNKKKLVRAAAGVVIVFILTILGCIFDVPYRLAYVIAVPLLFVGIIVGFSFLILYVSGLGLRDKWKGSIVSDLQYDDTKPENKYDLYFPEEKSGDGTYGFVMYIHGGSFTGGERSEGKNWCKHMAMRGYVAATMDYTVVKPGQESSLPNMVEEIYTCVNAIKSECFTRGYELTEMTVTGVSAGGCLAAMYAYSKAKSSPIPVKFLFQETGPMYFEPIWWGNSSGPESQAEFLQLLAGTNITPEMITNGEYKSVVEAISPACMVQEGSVPTLVAYGPNDRVVPVGLKFHLFSALEKYHVPYTYVEFPNSGHAMCHDPKEQLRYVKMVDEFCEKYFEHKPKTAK